MAEKQSRAKAAMGGKKKSSKKKKKSGKARKFGVRDRMTITRTANKKFNARHDYSDGGAEDHGLQDLDELKQHLDDHFGGEEEPQGAMPAPSPAGM